ncbi:molybdopterin-dependent oxidoreductase [Halomonas sp. 3H]|uniref:molybdopterin-dependent oxidoreductase n=1 Tax=Halomonas sp. 3H TaxID=2952527 RepID=UPI0020B828A6|nr:molybdopterin-dependent oxidoreductase [Halomonas sp. 3H]
MPTKSCTRIILLALAWLLPLVATASSGTAPLLTVQIGPGTPSLTLDRQTLLTLPQASMETRVPWHDEPARFEGPLLSSLIEHLEIRGDTLVVTGLDGYSTRLSLAESDAMGAMLAHRCNGKPLNVREFGPLLLLYPEGHGLSSQQRLFRTVWQVTHIDVE